MAKTTNKTPLTVKVYPSNDKFFTQSNWKGICTDKNYLNIDQETFEDCENIYLDDDLVLKSRPAVDYSDLLPDDATIDKSWNLSSKVYLLANNSLYELDKNTKTCRVCTMYADTLLGTVFNMIEHKTDVLIFASNGIFVVNDDVTIADDKIYVPETKIYSYVENEGQVVFSYQEGEERNLISGKEKTTHIFHKVNYMYSMNFIGKYITVKTDNDDEYTIQNFSVGDEKLIVCKLKTFPNSLVSTDVSNVSVADNGNSILIVNIENYDYAIYVSYGDWEYSYFTTVKSIIKPEISDEGDCFYSVADGIAKITSIYDVNDTTGRNIKTTSTCVGVKLKSKTSFVIASRDDEYSYNEGWRKRFIHLQNQFVADGNVKANLYRLEYDVVEGDPGAYEFYDGPLKVDYIDTNVRHVSILAPIGINSDEYQSHVFFSYPTFNIESSSGEVVNLKVPVDSVYWLNELPNVGPDRFEYSCLRSAKLGSDIYHYLIMAYDELLKLRIIKNSVRFSYDELALNSDKDIIKVNLSSNDDSVSGNFVVRIFINNFILTSSNTRTNIITKFSDFEKFTLVHDDVIPVHIDYTHYYYFRRVDDDNYNLYSNDPSQSTVYVSYISDTDVAPSYNFSSMINAYATYGAVGNKVYVSANNDKLYFPENQVMEFSGDVTNLFAISSTRIAIFLQDETWYIDYDGSGHILSKSKLSIGCKNNSTIETSPDGASVVIPSNDGLATLSYQQFVQSSDQIIQFLSDIISEQYFMFNTQPIKLRKYRYRIYCFNGTDTVYIIDYRNGSWWKYKFDGNVTDIFVLLDDIHFVINGRLVHFSTQYDYFDYGLLDVNWKIISQKLHFNSLHLYKNVKSIFFNSVQNDEPKTVSFKLAIKNYGTVVSDRYEQDNFVEYDVDLLRTFVKKCNSRKVNEFQYILSNDNETLNPEPLSLHSIIIKYNLGGQVK